MSTLNIQSTPTDVHARLSNVRRSASTSSLPDAESSSAACGGRSHGERTHPKTPRLVGWSATRCLDHHLRVSPALAASLANATESLPMWTLSTTSLSGVCGTITERRLVGRYRNIEKPSGSPCSHIEALPNDTEVGPKALAGPKSRPFMASEVTTVTSSIWWHGKPAAGKPQPPESFG